MLDVVDLVEDSSCMVVGSRVMPDSTATSLWNV